MNSGERKLTRFGRSQNWLQLAWGVDARSFRSHLGWLIHLARLFELLPAAPLTVAQVDLLLNDSLPASGMPGLRELGILPHRLEDALADLPAAP